jgi:hypothetical protein
MALVLLELVGCALSLNGSVAPCARKVEGHGLAKQLKAVDFVDCVFSRLDTVEDDESLAFTLQTGFGDNVDDGSIFFKDLAQSFDQLWDLDALGQVSGLQMAAVSFFCMPRVHTQL